MPRLVRSSFRRLVARCCGAALALVAAPAFAQNMGWPTPTLTSVFPLGGQPGGEVEVTVGGTDLDDARLVFSHPAIAAEAATADPKPYQTARPVVPNKFTVKIPADCPPGIYDVRTVGRFGASNPRSFVVDPSPDALEVEPNDEPAKAQEVALGATINGKTENRGFDHFKFHAKAGDRVLIELWSDRLDAKLDGTLVLLDSTGRELARGRDSAGLDPFVDFTAPAEGDYVVRVYDFTYQGGDQYAYRLSIGAGPRIDFVLPPLASKSGPSVAAIYGRNLPGGRPAPGIVVDGRPLEVLERPLQPGAGELAAAAPDAFHAPGLFVDPARASVNAFEFRLTTPAGTSNPVSIEATDSPIVLEKEPNDDAPRAQVVPVPCEIGGQFFPVNDQDVYAFTAKKGDVLWIEIASQRLGLEVDPMFVLQRGVTSKEGVESFQDVATADDPAAPPRGTVIAPGGDPSLLFTVPEDGSYRVLVRDLYSRLRPDPRCVYRLSIRPPKPDFRLLAFPRNPANQNDNYGIFATNVRAGGAVSIDVLAHRLEGFGGAAPPQSPRRRGKRAMEAASAGDPNDSSGEIELSVEGLPDFLAAAPVVIGPGRPSAMIVLRAKDDAPAWYGSITIRGKAEIGGRTVERVACAAAVTWPGQQNQSTGATRLTRDLPVCVIAREPAPYTVETEPKTFEVSRAGKLEIPLRVTRRKDFKGAIALTAVGTPQNVQIPAVTVAGDKSDGTLAITVPNNAALGRYTILLHGQATYSYVKNADAVAAAKADQEAAVKHLAEQQEAAKKAAEAKATAEKQLATAQEGAKKAAAAAAEAKKAADSAANDEGKKTQAEAAAKAATEAEAAVKAAQEAKTAADQEATAAQQRVKQAEQLKQQADQAASQVAKSGQPGDLTLIEPSTPIVFDVLAAPLDLEPSRATVAVGEKGEANVSFARLLDFADEVSLTLQLPKGVDGINVPKVDAPKGETTAKLAIDATAKATPGVHEATLRATVKYNGQSLTLDAPFTLTIAGPKDPTAK